jgi:hypothetical protein
VGASFSTTSNSLEALLSHIEDLLGSPTPSSTPVRKPARRESVEENTVQGDENRIVDLRLRRGEAALGRARRENARARHALARALAAEARLSAIEQNPVWRLVAPVRRFFHALPVPVRRLLRQTPPSLIGNSVTVSGAGSTLQSRSPPLPVALLIDDYWPRPDCDAGSIEIINLAAWAPRRPLRSRGIWSGRASASR